MLSWDSSAGSARCVWEPCSDASELTSKTLVRDALLTLGPHNWPLSYSEILPVSHKGEKEKQESGGSGRGLCKDSGQRESEGIQHLEASCQHRACLEQVRVTVWPSLPIVPFTVALSDQKARCTCAPAESYYQGSSLWALSKRGVPKWQFKTVPSGRLLREEWSESRTCLGHRLVSAAGLVPVETGKDTGIQAACHYQTQ